MSLTGTSAEEIPAQPLSKLGSPGIELESPKQPPSGESKGFMHSGTSSQPREITVAHSPDSDDAFMFYGLATNKVRVPGLKFIHTLCDIETLNQKAREGEGVYDVSAISFHAYPY